MKCYIAIYEDNYCDTNICKVFINEEDAEEFCKLQNIGSGYRHMVYESEFIGAITAFKKDTK